MLVRQSEETMRTLALGLLSAALAGCSVRTGDFTLASTKNIPSLQTDKRVTVEAEDCKLFTPPSLKEAVDNAIEKGRGNALVDAVLYAEVYPLFYNCYRVKGTVVQIKE